MGKIVTRVTRVITLICDGVDPQSYKQGFRDGAAAVRSSSDQRHSPAQKQVARQDKPNQKKPTPPKPIEDVLVLYVKADRGISILKELEVSHCLMPSWGESLTSEAMKMWLGTSEEYNKMSIDQVFLLPENISTMGKEYDFIACKFDLKKHYMGGHATDDSFSRHEFFNQICEDQVQCVKMSNRQTLTEEVCLGTWDV